MTSRANVLLGAAARDDAATVRAMLAELDVRVLDRLAVAGDVLAREARAVRGVLVEVAVMEPPC